MTDDHKQTFAQGVGWTIVLFPVALALIVFVLPHFLQILGAICSAMRAAAQAVKG